MSEVRRLGFFIIGKTIKECDSVNGPYVEYCDYAKLFEEKQKLAALIGRIALILNASNVGLQVDRLEEGIEND